jgi:hypothetical protein
MNNIKYVLVIPGRSAQFVKEFELSIGDRILEKDIGWGGCSKDEIYELNIRTQYIESQLHNDYTDEADLYNQWHRAMSMDSLSYNEALCVLLGIPVSLTNNFINVDLSKEDTELELDECHVVYEFYNTNENDFLFRKYKNNNSIDTKEFIEWSIDKNFIEKITTPSSEVKHRQATEKLQILIDSIAKNVMEKHPKSTQTNVAEDVADILKKEHDTDRSSDTIRTKNLKKHPNY